MALINAYLAGVFILGIALIILGAILSADLIYIAGIGLAFTTWFAAIMRRLNDER